MPAHRVRPFQRVVPLCLCAAALAQGDAPAPPTAQNPYRLEPFHADFPVALEYPRRSELEYDRSRRQALARVVANLQGNASRDAWLFATEFFWNAPDDAVELLVEAMDRAYGNRDLQDVVRNTVEAMGRMRNEAFDEPLRRALESRNTNVCQAAYLALSTSGKTATLRELYRVWPLMDGRARAAWLKAARTRLGADAVPMFKALMASEGPAAVREFVVKEALLMPLAQAAEIVRGHWPMATGEYQAILAGILHSAEDAAGTVWLRDALRGEDMQKVRLAIRNCRRGDLGVLREDLLRLSVHPRADVRLELVTTLAAIEGDDVTDAIEVMAADDREAWEARQIALREVTRRGRPQAVTNLLEELPTATGTRLQLMLNALATSGDDRVVAVLLDRFRKAPSGEGRPFLQALGLGSAKSAAGALAEVFLGPEIKIVHEPQPPADTTVTYVPVMLSNLRGQEAEVFALWRRLPSGDYRRRGALLPYVVGIGSDRDDPAIRREGGELARAVLFARDELPQLRVLALNSLRRHLTIDDAMRLKAARYDESPSLRALLNDFLCEYF